MSLSKMVQVIAIDQIRDNYWFGAYGEFRVVADMDNGFINASKMCKDGGKDFFRWSRLKSSEELINTLEGMIGDKELSEIGGCDEGDPKVCTENGSLALQITDHLKWRSVIRPITTANKSEEDKLVSGTYVHPDLIPSIAGWISPQFQIKANRVVNAFIAHQYKEQLANMQASNDSKTIIIDMKNEIIEMKNEIIDNQNELIQTTQQDHIEALETINQQLKTIDAKDNDIDMLEGVVQEKEVAIKKKDKIHQVWSNTHGFTMMRTNDPQSKLPYYAIRRKYNDMLRAIKLNQSFFQLTNQICPKMAQKYAPILDLIH
jgi:KilA-N domain